MINVTPVTLEGYDLRLEPLSADHLEGLQAAVSDGRLWELWYTTVPDPGGVAAYIAGALAGQDAGHMLPWAVRELATGTLIGSTRYHDIVPDIDRVEIGYTFYATDGSARTSILHASCCSSRTRSRCFAVRSSDCAPTISTSDHSGRSNGSAPRGTE